MQIVVNIDEKIYKALHPTNPVTFRRQQIEDMFLEMSCAIRNGKVIPKGHGDLKDYSQLDETMVRLNFEENEGITRGQYKIIDHVLFEMPTIIEADKEGDANADSD